MFEIIGSSSRLPCPKELRKKAEKAAWDDLIGSYTAEYFNAGDIPLLINYIRTKTLSDSYYQKLSKADDVVMSANGIESPSPYFKMWKDTVTSMNATATKLRVSPNGRTRPEAVKQSNRQAADGKVFNPGGNWEDFQVNPELNG